VGAATRKIFDTSFDVELQERIQAQPMLEWKALNVRRLKRLDD